MLSYFKWYRRLRGGRWAIVSGYLFNYRWVKVPKECVEKVDEEHRIWQSDRARNKHDRL